GIDEMAAILAGARLDGALHAFRRQREIGIASEIARQNLREVRDHPALPVLDRGEHLLGARDHHVAAAEEIRAARRHPDRVDVLGCPRGAEMAEHRTALLRGAGHVDDAAALAVEMCRHAEHRPDGDDAGAADAGDDDAVGLRVEPRQLRIGERRQIRTFGDRLALLELRAVDCDERRTEALEAAEILVAARLVDAALAPELGFERLHRYAVRLHAAVAAAFAHELVDDDALVWIRIEPALAAPAFLRRAGLIVDEHAHALERGELALDAQQLVAMMDGQAARPVDVRGIFPRLVGDDDHTLDARGGDLPGDLRHAQPAFIGLAAGHRHRVVEQDLVGDVDVRDD